MSAFKKYILLPEQEVQRLKQTAIKDYNPELSVIEKQTLNIEKILSDDSLPVEEKLRLFQIAKNEFQLLYDKYFKQKPFLEAEKPSSLATLEVLPENISPPNDLKNLSIDEIINSIHPRFRNKANIILEKMKANPKIASYNNTNQLVVRGKIIPGSNIIDLLKDIFQFKKSFAPYGRDSFLSSLSDLNIPNSYITNRSLSKYSFPTIKAQTGKGLNPPPGKRPKLHLVYH